jgi:hypothetical protein
MKLIAILFLILSCSNQNWRTASRESAKLAPQLADKLDESIVQIYTARAFSWRGNFAVHPWVAWKKKNEEVYTVAQVIGWRLNSTGSAIAVEQDIPDRKWYGRVPNIIFEARAGKADKIIKRFKELIKLYPYANTYRLYPGPNSNTFVAYLIQNTDEIKITLPPHAIGKDWPIVNKFAGLTPSGTGLQANAFGVLGLAVGLEEGIEINVLALNFGVDFYPLALKLPFIGRLGFDDKALTD